MGDYRLVLGEAAPGLGLGQAPEIPREEIAEQYQNDPAAAFSRMAGLMMPRGGAIPIPFANDPCQNTKTGSAGRSRRHATDRT